MSRSSTVPVLVVGGYLGAGKTTLINELLQNTSLRVAVVVNDFGSINIDASLIATSNSDTIELSNGCVCCAIGESLADTMLSIGERHDQPDVVVIEASGVADPRAVAANAFLTGFHLAGILVLVDSVNAGRTAKSALLKNTFERQLRAAHLIALTKEEAATPEQTESCRSLLTPLSTPVVSRSHLRLHDLLSHHHEIDVAEQNGHHAHFRTETIVDISVASQDELRIFCDSLPTSVVRAKGIAAAGGENFLVQRVGNHTAIVPTTLPPTGIVIIYAD